MFSFFKKKDSGTKIIDRIYRNRAALFNAIRQEALATPNLSIICWFDAAVDELQTLFEEDVAKPEIFQARETSAQHLTGKTIVFLEHYPLAEKEVALLDKLHVASVTFYSSLEDPLFKHFGGDRIAMMMDKFGMDENEVIQHPLVTSSIKNAQEKLAKSVSVEHSARSQAEWFEKNL